MIDLLFNQKKIYLFYYIILLIFLSGCEPGSADDDDLTNESRYKVIASEVNDIVELNLLYNSKHIMSLTNKDGFLKIIPDPGNETNRESTIWYPQPYLKGAVKGDTQIVNSYADNNGFHLKAMGNVFNSDSLSTGVWTLIMDFTYNLEKEMINGIGEINIVLGTDLDVIGDNLFVYKITSNYIEDVELINPDGFGNTGNMEKITAKFGENESLVWLPYQNPEFFPEIYNGQLSINVKGQYNNADTSTINKISKEPSYKPSVSIQLKTGEPYAKLNFGASYDYTNNKNYLSENVITNPIISKQTQETNFQFTIEFNSESIKNKDGSTTARSGDSCMQILKHNHSIGDYFYWIDLEGSISPIKVFCDMTNDDGGWILYASINDSSKIGVIKDTDYIQGYPQEGIPEITDIDTGNWIYKAEMFNDFVSVMKLEMGQVNDFFKPRSNYSFEQMITSYDKHLWSSNINTSFIQPEYYEQSPKHLGGSETQWPNNFNDTDNRFFLSFWGGGSGGGSGGCCSYNYNSTSWVWGLSFKLWIR